MKYFACVVALCFTMFGDPVAGQVVADANESIDRESVEPADVIIPFRLTKFNNIVIEAILNGKEKVHLMLHTAVNEVGLTEEGAKLAPSVQMDQKAKVESWGGAATARYSSSNKLQIGSLSWDDVTIFEGKHSGRETDGKFGLNLFGDRVVALDFDANVVRIHSALPADVTDYVQVPVDVMRSSMLVKGGLSIDDERIDHDIMIHSGYSGGLLLDDEFVAKHHLAERLKVTKESELKDSFGNVLKTKHAVLPQLKIGGKTFQDVPTGFFAGAIDQQRISVMGGELLKRFNMLIDLKNSTIYLKQNELTNTDWG